MSDPGNAARRRWMSVLAKAQPEALQHGWLALTGRPAFEIVTQPEYGSVMLQARAGGDGPGFYFGEITVTRSVVQLADGRVGIAYIPGCNGDHAITAAALDATLQGDDASASAAGSLVSALEADLAAARAAVQAEVAATRVEFSVKGQNE